MDIDIKSVLLVSDSPDLQEKPIEEQLATSGFTLIRVRNAKALEPYLHEHGLPHLAVIDLNLAHRAGFDLAKRLYAKGVPLITLGSSEPAEDEVLKALASADDYIRRQFLEPEELVMRVSRILSRIRDRSYAHGAEIAIEDSLVFYPAQQRIAVRGEERHLSPIEAALLTVLLQHRGELVDSDALIERVWRQGAAPEDRNALRVHMHRLRRKLRDKTTRDLILSKRGIGYLLS